MAMTRKKRWVLGIGGATLAILFGINTSWFAPVPQGEAVLLAHRGVHQLYDRTGLGPNDCTATRMLPSGHRLIENTLPSMRASFAAGADMLELDVHPTTDGEFAVFHDWTLECRTNGRGVTREASMATLRMLDVGFGYTADGGRTYPLRGSGVGMMPTLSEVLAAFPERKFLINFKSRWREEGRMLSAYLRQRGIDPATRTMVYGHDRPVGRYRAETPAAFGFTRAATKECTTRYLLHGWTGFVPSSCRNGAIAVPVHWRHLYWGWPNRFLARMAATNTQVILMGNVTNDRGAPGITDPRDLAYVPQGFGGIIWTDAIETVGPAWQAMRSR